MIVVVLIPRNERDGRRFHGAYPSIHGEALRQWQGYTVQEAEGWWLDGWGEEVHDLHWQLQITFPREDRPAMEVWLVEVERQVKEEVLFRTFLEEVE